MSSDDNRQGLLAKVAKQGGRPGAIEPPPAAADPAFSGRALQEMIARKRRNDSIRNREFDQLRRLKSRSAGAADPTARPSHFATSLSASTEGRAMTLSKIDAIEAQMSDQWWQGEATRPAAAQTSTLGEAFAKLPESPDYQATQPDWLAADRAHADSLGFLPTALMASLELRSAVGKAQSLPPAERPAGDAAGFSVHWDDVISSPELEEAAIRFANGDSSGAEAGLLDAIRRAQARPDQIRNWAWALFDLYRATGRKSGFDHLADECLRRFGWPPPNWAPIPPAADHAAAEAIDPLAQSVPSAERVWRSPAHFDVASLGELRRTLANAPQPWKLDWSAMHSLDPAAVQGLATQFGDWCETAAQLCFAAADRLQHVLRVYTTAAGGSAGTAAWQLRMDALRLMGLRDTFELVALEYCVNFEVAPPAWHPARCHFTQEAPPAVDAPAPVNASPPAQRGAAELVEAPPEAGAPRPAGQAELWGDLLGEATEAMARLDNARMGNDRLVISCAKLVRVDFPAAGDILQWVGQRHAEGCQLQFRDLHRLIAAFFHLIGIDEQSSVLARSD